MQITTHQSNLAKTTLYMLDDDHYDFDMRLFSRGATYDILPSAVHACGTSCCLSGYAIPALTTPEEAARFTTWDAAETHLLGEFTSMEWEWLFAENWPSDRIHAAHRVLHWLERGAIPGGFLGSELDYEAHDQWVESWCTPEELRPRLQAFVIENPTT